MQTFITFSKCVRTDVDNIDIFFNKRQLRKKVINILILNSIVYGGKSIN